MDYDQEDMTDPYDPDLYEDFGEGFEDEFDAVADTSYEQAFEEAQNEASSSIKPIEKETNEFEYDSVVGGRDKKPVMGLLNKGKVSKYEMDDLLNSLD
ncbi:MAG: hypothetical protein ACQESC_01100 [Nanobdellota archaeon]